MTKLSTGQPWSIVRYLLQDTTSSWLCLTLLWFHMFYLLDHTSGKGESGGVAMVASRVRARFEGGGIGLGVERGVACDGE